MHRTSYGSIFSFPPRPLILLTTSLVVDCYLLLMLFLGFATCFCLLLQRSSTSLLSSDWDCQQRRRWAPCWWCASLFPRRSGRSSRPKECLDVQFLRLQRNLNFTTKNKASPAAGGGMSTSTTSTWTERHELRDEQRICEEEDNTYRIKIIK